MPQRYIAIGELARRGVVSGIPNAAIGRNGENLLDCVALFVPKFNFEGKFFPLRYVAIRSRRFWRPVLGATSRRKSERIARDGRWVDLQLDRHDLRLNTKYLAASLG